MNDLKRYDGELVERVPVSVQAQPDSGGASTTEMIAGILRRWYIVLLTFLVICGAGIPAIWLSIEPRYRVTGAIHVAPILENILTAERDSGTISNYQSFMNTQAEMITSNEVVQRVADDLAGKNLRVFEGEPNGIVAKLKSRFVLSTPTPDPADKMKQAIRNRVILVEPANYNEFIKISMESINRAEAEQVVNAFIRAYMAVEVSSSTQGQDQKLAVLENERKVLTEKLQRQRETIQQLAHEYGTVVLDMRQNMMLQRVASLLTELTKVESQKINLETQVYLLEQTEQETTKPEELLRMRQEYINKDPAVGVLTANILQLEQELIVARQVLAATNPELKRRIELLEAIKARLEEHKERAGKAFDDLMSAEIASASGAKVGGLRTQLQQITTYENRLREILTKEDTATITVGRKQLAIQDLQDQLNFTKETYDTVLRRLQELEMERKRPARISVAYNADISSVRDERVKYTMALMFGAMACGMLLALLREKADVSLYTPEDVTRRIGIRIIGTTTGTHAVKKALLPKQVAEDYQTIRANLGLIDGEGIPKKLVITSPGPREGKTTFAVNLATSMSKSGKKVLLIDGDLRKPDVGHLLGLPKGSRGLQDLLFGRNGGQAVCSINSSGLDVLPADSRNAADACELLALPTTGQRISEVSESYDHVIIDTPPVLAFPDALLWAKVADAVVLASFAGRTTAPDLKEAREKLLQVNVKVLGTVLSNVEVGRGYYRYGYQYAQSSRRKADNDSRRSGRKVLLLPSQNEGKTSKKPKR